MTFGEMSKSQNDKKKAPKDEVILDAKPQSRII